MQLRRYYVLGEDDYNAMQQQLREAIHYCTEAVPYRHDSPAKYTYPGATGWSQSAMEDIQHRLNALPMTVELD